MQVETRLYWQYWLQNWEKIDENLAKMKKFYRQKKYVVEDSIGGENFHIQSVSLARRAFLGSRVVQGSSEYFRVIQTFHPSNE